MTNERAATQSDPGDLVARFPSAEAKRAQQEELAVADRKARRERIATALLAGMYANPGHWNSALLGSPVAAAVVSADALIAELDKPVGGQ